MPSSLFLIPPSPFSPNQEKEYDLSFASDTSQGNPTLCTRLLFFFLPLLPFDRRYRRVSPFTFSVFFHLYVFRFPPTRPPRSDWLLPLRRSKFQPPSTHSPRRPPPSFLERLCAALINFHRTPHLSVTDFGNEFFPPLP